MKEVIEGKNDEAKVLIGVGEILQVRFCGERNGGRDQAGTGKERRRC